MEKEDKELLKNTRLFDALSPEEFEILCTHVVYETYKTGDSIILEGEVGDCLYVIKSGLVRIFSHTAKGKEFVLARLEEGQFFGEQALLKKRPGQRTKSAIALSLVVVICIKHVDFQKCLNTRLKSFLTRLGRQEVLKKLLQQLENESDSSIHLEDLIHKREIFLSKEPVFSSKSQDNYVYYLLSGAVEVYSYDDMGEKSFHYLIKPGQFFVKKTLLDIKNQAEESVAVVKSEIIFFKLELFEKNKKLTQLINQSMELITLPFIGIATRYQGFFLSQPAIYYRVKKEHKDALLIARLMTEDVYAVFYEESMKKAQELNYKESDGCLRKIYIINQKIVGIISFGIWDDLELVTRLVVDKAYLSDDWLDEFHKTGHIANEKYLGETGNNILCHCMQVSYAEVKTLLIHGCSTFEEISEKSSVGRVCGGCKPKILDLLGANVWNLVQIKKIHQQTKRIRSYELQAIKNITSAYYPGQHVLVKAEINKHNILRSYTLTKADLANNRFEITVSHKNLGIFSSWLFKFGRHGTLLYLSPPQGKFLFQLDPATPIVCFMAGVGITPAIALMRHVDAVNYQGRIFLDYSVLTKDEIAFKKELHEWQKNHKNFQLNLRVTNEVGNLTEDSTRAIVEAVGKHARFYICGPEGYEKALMNYLLAAGASIFKIHIECFISASKS